MDVFLSYIRSDHGAATEIAHFLTVTGFSVWWDRHIRAGTDFSAEIEREIASARAVVVLWSEASHDSQWVRDEAAYARDRNKLIPVRIDTSTPPLGFGQVQCIALDGQRDRDAAFAELAGAVRTLTNVPTLLQTPSTPDRSVAVLPFTDLSETQAHAYLGEGIADELSRQLSRVPGLHVSARTSSFSFKGKQKTVREIARELGVAQLLEGSVQVNANRLRVTTQLIRADNGYQLWSERYDRELRDVFSVQDDIALAAARALRPHVSYGSLTLRRGGTQNLEAYQLYLRALRERDKATPDAYAAAADYVNRALKLDPRYGLAWVELATIETLRGEELLVPRAEGYERARELANRALEVSPEVSGAHAVLMWISMVRDWDWAGADDFGRRALEVDPSDSTMLYVLATLRLVLGDREAAVRLVRDALALDPRNPYLTFHAGEIHYRLKRYEEADELFRRTLELEPGFFFAHLYLGQSLVLQNKLDAASALLGDPAMSAIVRLFLLPFVMQASGRPNEADTALEAVIAAGSEIFAYGIAFAAAFLGKHDLAFEWLERAYRQKDGVVYLVGCEPMLSNVVDDSRYEAFLRKMNLRQVTL